MRWKRVEFWIPIPSATLSPRSQILIGGVFVVCSACVYPLMERFSPRDAGAITVFICFGVIGAAAALLAIYAVLNPRPFWPRMLISFCVGLLMFAFWVIGFAASTATSRRSLVDDEWRSCGIALLCLPLIFLAIQSPLWLVRLVFRWDLASPTASPHLHPLTIRDVLVAISLIGLGLGGARFAQPLAEQNGISSEVEFWLLIGVGLASCIGISLVSTLPIVVATLRARKPALAMLVICICSAIILVTSFTVIGIVAPPVPIWATIEMSTTVLTFTTAVAIPLLITRGRGFRLVWGRESIGLS